MEEIRMKQKDFGFDVQSPSPVFPPALGGKCTQTQENGLKWAEVYPMSFPAG